MEYVSKHGSISSKWKKKIIKFAELKSYLSFIKKYKKDSGAATELYLERDVNNTELIFASR